MKAAPHDKATRKYAHNRASLSGVIAVTSPASQSVTSVTLTPRIRANSDDPSLVMARFADWLAEGVRDRPIFIADNNGFDWQFINWCFHHFYPFGFSSQNLGSLYKGLVKDASSTFKHLRKTRHTHHPVDDAKGNAEAFLHMKEVMGLRIRL